MAKPSFNSDLVYQVLRVKASNKRRPLAATKDRAEVSGGGKKPWPQKGTGRSRHGSIRSPLWRGGGITFGPRKERTYKGRIPRKMALRALLMVFEKKRADNEVKLVDDIAINENKTKVFAKWLKEQIGGEGSALIVGTNNLSLLKRVSGNIPRVTVTHPRNVDIEDMLAYNYCIITKDAQDKLIKRITPIS